MGLREMFGCVLIVVGVVYLWVCWSLLMIFFLRMCVFFFFISSSTTPYFRGAFSLQLSQMPSVCSTVFCVGDVMTALASDGDGGERGGGGHNDSQRIKFKLSGDEVSVALTLGRSDFEEKKGGMVKV